MVSAGAAIQDNNTANIVSTRKTTLLKLGKKYDSTRAGLSADRFSFPMDLFTSNMPAKNPHSPISPIHIIADMTA